ncbi:MAG: J domain-containing protein [Methanobacterium sp.]|nr:J domain-containing protein [Methanobacterium sp.]
MVALDPYGILDVPRDATPDLIKGAYRAKAKHAHPDLGGDPRTFRLLKYARDLLLDETRRHDYDSTGNIPDNPPRQKYDDEVQALVGSILVASLPQIHSPDYENVLCIMREKIAGRIAELRKEIPERVLAIEKMSAIVGRIQAVEGENVLRTIVTSRRDALQDEREGLIHEMESCEQALDFLDDYQYFIKIENILISSDVWCSRDL